jgi:hypothetical protein
MEILVKVIKFCTPFVLVKKSVFTTFDPIKKSSLPSKIILQVSYTQYLSSSSTVNIVTVTVL